VTDSGHSRRIASIAFLACAAGIGLFGCSAADYRRAVDRTAYEIIADKQAAALGKTEPFTVEAPAETLRRRLLIDQRLLTSTPASLSSRDVDPIPQWPDRDYLERERPHSALAESLPTTPQLVLTLADALQVAAHGARNYQDQKEAVFTAALQLDLERDAFRRTWTGILSGLFESRLEREVALDDEGHTDRQTVSGLEYGASGELSQQFRNGMTFTGALGVDLVSLLTQERPFSRGIVADVTATIPLMRGSGEFVVTEPLTQAERNVVYALYEFEQFKRDFAVDVASDYLAVLQQLDQIENAYENYNNLILSTRRARRLAAAGRLPEIQVDQSLQDELRARQRWVQAGESYYRRLDAFKVSLGLPTDADIALDHAELDRLNQLLDELRPAEPIAQTQAATAPATQPAEIVPPGQGTAGPHELDPREAIVIALTHRPDLRVVIGRVDDAQRTVAVAADQLRADVTLLGSGSAGARRTLDSADLPDAILRPDEGVYSALLTVDLPLERTREGITYRSSLVGFEQAVRDVQELEDQVKLAVRNRLSELLEARESIQIQVTAVAVAERRIASTNMFLEAGRAEIRDILEAQEAHVSAKNALTAALVNYRIAELALQRDLGVLEVNERGLWTEYTPGQKGVSEDVPVNP